MHSIVFLPFFSNFQRAQRTLPPPPTLRAHLRPHLSPIPFSLSPSPPNGRWTRDRAENGRNARITHSLRGQHSEDHEPSQGPRLRRCTSSPMCSIQRRYQGLSAQVQDQSRRQWRGSPRLEVRDNPGRPQRNDNILLRQARQWAAILARRQILPELQQIPILEASRPVSCIPRYCLLDSILAYISTTAFGVWSSSYFSVLTNSNFGTKSISTSKTRTLQKKRTEGTARTHPLTSTRSPLLRPTTTRPSQLRLLRPTIPILVEALRDCQQWIGMILTRTGTKCPKATLRLPCHLALAHGNSSQYNNSPGRKGHMSPSSTWTHRHSRPSGKNRLRQGQFRTRNGSRRAQTSLGACSGRDTLSAPMLSSQ
jgi:hypothetical protein